jgi:hypothetical protein
MCASPSRVRTGRCAPILSSNEPVILQIPVGCGKTGVIATLPFGIAHDILVHVSVEEAQHQRKCRRTVISSQRW